jgi:signal transduction histidine kinase
MFLRSRSFNRVRKTIGFRLTIWYSSILIASFLILFFFAYLYFSSSIRKYDRDIIQTELNECVIQFQREGVDGLRKEVEFEKHVSGGNPFFVRLATSENKTIFLNIPDEWKRLDLEKFESSRINSDKEWIHLQLDDEEFEIASVRLVDGHVLQAGKSTEDRGRLLRRFHVNSAVFIISVIMLTFSGGMFLASRTLRPIRSLIETLRSIIETGKMEVRAPTHQTGDELDVLATLFNVLLGKINILITGMQRSLDNVAHDLRTPLMRLRGIAETALRSEQTREGSREALMDSLEESERIVSMLNTLMDISEADAGTMKLHLEEVDLLDLIEDVVRLYQHVAEERGIRIHTSCARGLYLTVDLNRMRQALANLLDNAIKYTRPGGRVDIEARSRQYEIVIMVSDRGMGISHEELPKIWDRLYRGDKSRSEHGLGLGLSLVKAIVQAHKGHVDVSSISGVGSSFYIYLPKNH